MWKTPVEKPDVFKPHRILVIYEAHDEPELMLSTEFVAFTADRYVNRWCYWDEFIAQADKAERLLDVLPDIIEYIEGKCDYFGAIGEDTKLESNLLDKIKQLIKEK